MIRASRMRIPSVSAHLATYPPRLELLRSQLRKLRTTFGVVHICMNEYAEVPVFMQGDERIRAFIPARDQKDVGKFAIEKDPAEFVFLIDDDIEYPDNYVPRMLAHWHTIGNGVVGVHGVRYLPSYRGGAAGRDVIWFVSGRDRYEYVDALGTGTVLLRATDLPNLEYMMGSQMFVDIRFARYCAESSLPMISVPRPKGWLRPIENDGQKIYLDFTREENPAVLRDVEAIIAARGTAGGPRLDTIAMKIRGIAGAGPASFARRLLSHSKRKR